MKFKLTTRLETLLPPPPYPGEDQRKKSDERSHLLLNIYADKKTIEKAEKAIKAVVAKIMEDNHE